MSEEQQAELPKVNRWWPHLRALLIAAHLCSVVILALPSSHRLADRKFWDRPQQKADMRRWADTFGVEPEVLDAFLWRWTQRYVRARRWVSRPFLRYADYTGARQGWTMFSGPRRGSGRYEVEVEIDGTYVSVFRTQDSDATWNRAQFEHNRVRKLMAKLTSHPQMPAYSELTRWIAKRAAEDFPTATRCRITLYTWTMLSAEENRAGKTPKESRTRSQRFDLEALR